MGIDWNEILSEALQGVLVLVLPALAVTLWNFVKAKAAEIYAKIEAEKPDVADFLERAAEFAVQAAEKLELSQLLAEQYENKKEAAIDIAERWLMEQGLVIDIDLIADAIEVAVAKLFPKELPEK